MENFQLQPNALADAQSLAGASPQTDIAAWLDGFLAALGSGAMAPELAQESLSRLRDASFDEILAAITRAQPGLGNAAEIAFYQRWIEANPTSQLLWAAWFNTGVVCAREGNNGNAAIAYNNTLLLRPDTHAAAINLGLLLEASGQAEQALATWQRAVQPDAVRVALEVQQGRLLERLGRLDEAERILHRALLTDPVQQDVLHHWLHIRQKMCLWPVALLDVPGYSERQLMRSCGPLGVLALTDDIELQTEAAAAWINRKTEPAPRRLAPEKPYLHERIRIGYMSSDFCSHAMSYLITELFERHDRKRFEIFGYCASHEDGTQLRQRVVAAFDHFRIIRTLSDEQAAQVIRDDEIDVLIDLNGITDGSRMAVLRWRPAPIQATYLGFIGPVPLPELDYLLCDNLVIPPEHENAYRPQPLAVSRIYQVNDSKRTIGRRMSRAEAGLPEDRFVLCCFSKHYKITEEIFGAWISILQQAEHTVLWLAKDNAYAQANLIAAAKCAGIAEERLIFSDRADPDLYMSRLGLADLFLDTFPYNAGTVASDAMRMGLPLVTLCGQSFVSRMAASLLHAMGASQGITTSLAKYVETAVRLAKDPVAYTQYKALFTTEAWNGSIGNIERFTAEFEDTWTRVVRERRGDGGQRTAPRQSLAGRMPEASAGGAALAPPAPAAAAQFSLALQCTTQGRYQEAIDAYCQAITLQPDFAEAYINLGAMVLALGQREAALGLLRRAVALRPDHAPAQGNFAKVLQDLGHIDEAIAAYRTAIDLQPDNAVNLINLGAALVERQAWNEAVTVTRRALALQPGAAIAHANLGTALLQLGRYDAALEACRQAVALQPQEAAILATLGGAMLELGEFREAIRLCRGAIAVDAALPNAHFNLSHAHKSLNELEAAALAARQAIALRPESAEYHFHLAHILLLRGDLVAGWEEYEWRWKMPNFADLRSLRSGLKKPEWRGEDLGGKTLLVYTEQGLGDIMQFARYLPLLVRQAKRVIVAVNPAVRRMLQTIEGITVVSLAEALALPFDMHCALMSLPRACATQLDSIPMDVPYLHADAAERARWARRIGGKGLRVGIVWAGNPATLRDRFRSPGLASVAPLFAVPGIDFVVLQMGAGRQHYDENPLPPHVLDLGGEIDDLADTAAIMSGLDLVISSCTGPLHLAGALGVPVWAMLPFAPHFPWLLERSDTLWYPTMRLYRQEQPGRDWSGVVGRIAGDLQVLAQSKRERTAPQASPRSKTLIFCTSYARDPADWDRRYGRWIDAITQSEMPQDQILIVDDGSAELPPWPGVTVVSEAACPTPQAAPVPGGVMLYHFEANLGRVDVWDFPGWYRSFAFAAQYAEAHGFERVIHIESDAFLISKRVQDHLGGLSEGWVALHCSKYNFPELAITAAAGQGVRDFASWTRQPAPFQHGRAVELVVPFSKVEREFIGDRYGEYLPEVPREADYVAQTQVGREQEYYWWMLPKNVEASAAAGPAPKRGRKPREPVSEFASGLK
jgi:predicted O-linked N-acetylglucosamine transferase (SPINDLY family)